MVGGSNTIIMVLSTVPDLFLGMKITPVQNQVAHKINWTEISRNKEIILDPLTTNEVANSP